MCTSPQRPSFAAHGHLTWSSSTHPSSAPLSSTVSSLHSEMSKKSRSTYMCGRLKKGTPATECGTSITRSPSRSSSWVLPGVARAGPDGRSAPQVVPLLSTCRARSLVGDRTRVLPPWMLSAQQRMCGKHCPVPTARPGKVFGPRFVVDVAPHRTCSVQPYGKWRGRHHVFGFCTA